MLLDRAFRFRGLSRASIQKLSLRIEIDLKAKGFSSLNTTNNRARTQSGDNLPSPKALQEIQGVSKTLTYKQVRVRLIDKK